MPDAVPIFALVAGAWLGHTLAVRVPRRRIARARESGRRGEARAAEILRRHGYRVIAREVRATVRVRIDGRREEYTVRADAIVRRWWRRYVVEIKTGASATTANRATRRQLFEYAHAFGCRRVLLVDADDGRVHRIEFG